MKLLFDEGLSPKLVLLLAACGRSGRSAKSRDSTHFSPTAHVGIKRVAERRKMVTVPVFCPRDFYHGLLGDLFPNSESALRNGLAGAGDSRILDYAAAHDFILISTDSDFERLLARVPAARVVILRACDYPTEVAAEVLRRNAIRIAELPFSQDHLIILDK